MSNFTQHDADAIIQMVQSAPLANMRHAQEVSALLQRFQAWYKAQTAPPVEAEDDLT